MRFLRLMICLIAGSVSLMAQAPTGVILGAVSDPSGGVIPKATVTLENKALSVRRTATTDAAGSYSFTALPPGTYEVKATAGGFAPMTRSAEVFVGRELTVNFELPLGTATEAIQVSGEALQVNTTESKIDGIVSRKQIDTMPLNGRNALELARLQPGVLVGTGVPSGKNDFVGVSIAGETAAATRITVDGGSVNDYVTGGAEQNFSQEVVQEFQVSTGNFDPSTGITAAGSINIVTRSGSNQFHGTGFLFWRDSSFAAYPALERGTLDPHPKFDREQYGYLASGPVVRDRLFWLTSIDRTRQRGVAEINPNNLDLTAFAGLKKEPFDIMLQTHKLDWNAGQRQRMNLRYSRDGNAARAGGGLPENQRINQNSADQYLFNWNAVLTAGLVNDFRIQFNKYSNYYKPTSEAVAQGYPSTSIRQSNIRFGIDDNSPQSTLLGRLEMHDNMAQQKGRHGLKYGASLERDRARGSYQYRYPASMTLYSPAEARAAGIPIPAAFRTREDLLQLPLQSFQFGVGNPEQPPFHPERSRINHRVRFYFGDSWKVRPNLTLNLALSYSFEDNLVNADLPKPSSLSKILNGAIAPTRRDFNNLAPRFGFAWTPGRGTKTSIRGGYGIYYDTLLLNVRLVERTYLAPYGVGYAGLDQSYVPNPLNPRQTLDVLLQGPTPIRGADLVRLLPSIRGPLEQQFSKSQSNEDLSVTNLDAFHSGTAILDPSLTTPYSMHYTLGVQRELPHGILLSADGEFKQSVHEIFSADYNKYRRVAARGGPIDPYNGKTGFNAVGFYQTGATARYKALLVRAEKRYSRRYQFLASYALSSFVGMNGSGLFLGSGVSDNDNWKDSFGPQGGDRRHRVVAGVTVDLPRGFQVSAISETISRGPGSLGGGNYDYNGDGTRGDRLPFLKNNQVNRSVHESDVAALVARFNSEYAGKRDAQGALIAPIPALPAKYQLGDAMWSQDLRLTKALAIRERYRISGVAEVFNLFNIANLGGFSGDLYNAKFGQPTSRMNNVFGTGGPRAFQLALRFGF